MGRSVIPRYSAAQKISPQIVPKITIFLVFMNKAQILLFALRGEREREKEESENRNKTKAANTNAELYSFWLKRFRVGQFGLEPFGANIFPALDRRPKFHVGLGILRSRPVPGKSEMLLCPTMVVRTSKHPSHSRQRFA